MTELIAALRAIFDAWTTGERLNFPGEFYRHTLMTPNFSPRGNSSATADLRRRTGPRPTRATAEVDAGLPPGPGRARPG